MTPLESETLQHLGVLYSQSLEELSIIVFLYGAPSSLANCDMWLIHNFRVPGVFIMLFSASVVIFLFVFSFGKATYFRINPET